MRLLFLYGLVLHNTTNGESVKCERAENGNFGKACSNDMMTVREPSEARKTKSLKSTMCIPNELIPQSNGHASLPALPPPCKFTRAERRDRSVQSFKDRTPCPCQNCGSRTETQAALLHQHNRFAARADEEECIVSHRVAEIWDSIFERAMEEP